MLKTRTWIICFAAAALLLALLSWFLLGGGRTEGRVVQVIQDGTVLREIDLDRVGQGERFTVEWPGGGSNLVEVQPGRIRVCEADCPDQVCVHQGWLGDGADLPLVCLPHRLVIVLKEASGELDAAAR